MKRKALQKEDLYQIPEECEQLFQVFKSFMEELNSKARKDVSVSEPKGPRERREIKAVEKQTPPPPEPIQDPQKQLELTQQLL